MVHWTDPSVVELHGNIFRFVATVLLGLHGWETICGLYRDVSIAKSISFGPQMFPKLLYFVCKYSALVSLIGINVTNNAATPIACQSWYTNNQIWGNIAIGSSSTLLLHRTIVILNSQASPSWWWGKITFPLILLSLGQWSVLFYAVSTVKSKWNSDINSCIITSTYAVPLTAVYVVTMALDFIVLALALLNTYNNRDSTLWNILFRDGILYFVVAFTSNLIATTFIILQLNPVMVIMFTVPACIFSAIVACRSVVHLWDYKNKKAQSDAPQNQSGGSSTTYSSELGIFNHRDRRKKSPRVEEVVITMAPTILRGSEPYTLPRPTKAMPAGLQRYEHKCDAGESGSFSRGMVFASTGRFGNIEVGPASCVESVDNV